MGFTTPPPFKSIAVIGAGPCGVAVAKALLAEKVFTKVKVFERQEAPGGVWNYREETTNTPLIPSVRTNAREPTVLDEKKKKAIYFSPMYKNLETNIPCTLMVYNNTPFDKNLPLFPSRSAVLDYVQSYAKPIEQYVRYNADVQSVTKAADGTWTIEYIDFTENFPKGKGYSEVFDAVVVCSGHYDLPRLPDVKGISAWNETFPGSIQHSKYFDDPSIYKDKTVLVVGNSASGFDISMQVAEYSKKVYRSISSESKMPFIYNPKIEDVPVIEEFIPEKKEIVLAKNQQGFEDRDPPRSLTGIDSIIYCTGYIYSFPFIKTYNEPKNPDSIVSAAGLRINHLYRHTFYIPDPSLAFVGMNVYIIPFPLAENQGSVIARVFSGRLPLPSDEIMFQDERKALEANGFKDAGYHNLLFPRDVEFYKSFQDWMYSETVDTPELKKDEGFVPEPWTKEKIELRENALKLKEASLKAKVVKVFANKL